MGLCGTKPLTCRNIKVLNIFTNFVCKENNFDLPGIYITLCSHSELGLHAYNLIAICCMITKKPDVHAS